MLDAYLMKCSFQHIYANLKIYKYTEYELCHECFSRNCLKIFRAGFSNTTAGRMLLISSGCSLKIFSLIVPFNSLTAVGKGYTCLGKPPTKTCRFVVCVSMYVLLLPPVLKD